MFFGIRKQKIGSVEHEKGEKILWDFLFQKTWLYLKQFLDNFSKHKTLISES